MEVFDSFDLTIMPTNQSDRINIKSKISTIIIHYGK